MKRLLVVDDEEKIRLVIRKYAEFEGYEIEEAENGMKAIQMCRQKDFDLIILDIMMPELDGFSTCKEIRKEKDIPVIMVTAKGAEYDKVMGQDAGADDYVTKPFSVTVLCKKVAAVFANLELRTPRHDLFDDGFLKIDFSEQSASLAGESLDFTPKEYRTLFLFVKNPRIILTKRQILEKLWDIDGDFVDEHTLTTIISRIRKKIETDERKYIKTAYGMGYQWIGGEPR